MKNSSSADNLEDRLIDSAVRVIILLAVENGAFFV